MEGGKVGGVAPCPVAVVVGGVPERVRNVAPSLAAVVGGGAPE